MATNNKVLNVDFESSVQKSNEFSMAKLNQGLTLNQMQLLAYAIYCTQFDGKTEFHKSDFEKRFGIEKYQTVQARKDVPKLSRLQFSLVDMEEDIVDYMNIFQRIKYEKGLFIFKWSDDMIPHILELQDNYITSDLTVTSQFKSSYSWTLYDYLKAHYGYWHKKISKEGIMNLFGVNGVKSYEANTGILKKKVLDVAIAEINKFTELNIAYDEIKEGRTIIGFRLNWSTGKKVVAATSKQVMELNFILETIDKDTLRYMDLKSAEDRKEVAECVRKALDMAAEVNAAFGGGLTKKRAELMLIEANRLKKLLELKVEMDKDGRVPLYNWLEERE